MTLKPEDLDLETVLHFNTGREYSDEGQKIHACKTKDGEWIVMVDETRGLRYAYDANNCPLYRTAIMHHYDNNWHATNVHVPWDVARLLLSEPNDVFSESFPDPL